MLLALFASTILANTLHTQRIASFNEVEACVTTQYFRGPITANAAAALVERIEKCKPKTLVISSEGGDEDAALQIATALKNNDIELEIDQACLSACAQIIMLGMPFVSIRPLTIVGFHHSAFAINEWSAPYRERAAEYRALYDGSVFLSEGTARIVQNEAKLDLLRYAFGFIEPKCLLPGDAKSRWQWKILMSRQFWFPRRAELEGSGLVINGDWENIPPSISTSPETNFSRNENSLVISGIINIGLLPHCHSAAAK